MKLLLSDPDYLLNVRNYCAKIKELLKVRISVMRRIMT